MVKIEYNTTKPITKEDKVYKEIEALVTLLDERMFPTNPLYTEFMIQACKVKTEFQKHFPAREPTMWDTTMTLGDAFGLVKQMVDGMEANELCWCDDCDEHNDRCECEPPNHDWRD